MSSVASKNNIEGQFIRLGQVMGQKQAAITRLLTVIFVALIAWFLGKMIWSMFTPPTTIHQWKPSVQSTSSMSNTPSSSDVSGLLNANLFGVYQASPEVVDEDVVEDAPQTRLNLTLVGAVSSSDQNQSLAIIANNNRQATYGVGETIENTRATLKAVFIDRVIIRNQGRDETLMLQGLDYNTAPETLAAQKRNNNTETPDSSTIARIKEEITENPQAVFKYIRLSQVMVEGELTGYRVRPGNERALFDQVGLLDGDIAISLNGKDLTNPAEATSLWKDAFDVNEWSLTVLRDGQNHDIYIQF